jgi:hypothetical protein
LNNHAGAVRTSAKASKSHADALRAQATAIKEHTKGLQEHAAAIGTYGGALSAMATPIALHAASLKSSATATADHSAALRHASTALEAHAKALAQNNCDASPTLPPGDMNDLAEQIEIAACVMSFQGTANAITAAAGLLEHCSREHADERCLLWPFGKPLKEHCSEQRGALEALHRDLETLRVSLESDSDSMNLLRRCRDDVKRRRAVGRSVTSPAS